MKKIITLIISLLLFSCEKPQINEEVQMDFLVVLSERPKVNTIEGCQIICEGILNDFESGIASKEESLTALRHYTFKLHNFFADKIEDKS